jgi:hypothetical protein
MAFFNLPMVVDELARQEVLVGAFLLAIGLVFMLLGLRLSRVLVALSFGVIGFVVGCGVPGPDEARIAVGMITAVGLGGASLWMVRPSVAVLAGVWAGVLAFLVVGMMGVDDEIALVAGLVVFAGAASMAYVMLQEVIALVTSLEGTLLFLAGLIIVLNQSPMFWMHMRNLLVSHSVFGAFLVLSGTIVGFYTQIAELQKKHSGRSA